MNIRLSDFQPTDFGYLNVCCIPFCRMPAAFVQQMGPKLRPGRLLRFSIQQGGMMFGPDGRPAGADLKYEGPGNERRGRADAYSKVDALA